MTPLRATIWLCSLLFLALLAGCGGGVPGTLPPPGAGERAWTILVFLNADNDLERFGIEDVNEMESVPDSEEVAVVVQMDRIAGYDTSNGNWTGARRFRIRHDDDPHTITSPVLEDLGEIDSGDPATLRDFLIWGRTHFPARHTMLIIWNHGSGWRTFITQGATASRAVSYDDTFGTAIRLSDLPGALAGPPLDIVAFDASLMQMLEVAYEIRHTCRYIVGSEESPPGAGYPYHRWLGPLVENPRMTPRELGEVMARETLRYYGAGSNITHSVLDTAALDRLAAALDRFAAVLLEVGPDHAAALAAARAGAQHFAYYDYKDLYHYAALVKASIKHPRVHAAANEVMDAVRRAVVAEYHGSARPNAHGISIYLPAPTSFVPVAGDYRALALSGATRWPAWLAGQPR